MAELMVAAVIRALTSATATELIQNSFIFLYHQLSLVRGVHDMMDKIKIDLMSIQSLLCFADQKMHQRKELRGGKSSTDDSLLVGWVTKVRDVAYKVEVILNTHMYGISNRGEDGVVKRYLRKLRILTTYRKTAAELERIDPSVKEIMDIYSKLICQQLSLDLNHGCEGSSSSISLQKNFYSNQSRFAKEDVFFSLNEKGVSQKYILEKWILEQPTEFANVPDNIIKTLDVRLMCIALWGMGGIGKTTLLRQIYNHNTQLLTQFNSSAWVTVSKIYRVVDLLRNMIKELVSSTHVDTRSNSEEELINIVHGILDNKRYLIVFDDVWEDDFWIKIENIFLRDHDRRSRILFTTRDKNVALSVAKESRVMELELLREEEAWLLFCKKAFWQDIESQCPPHLVECAGKIVGKCGGLPLAIVASAGMMSKKQRNISEWKESYRMLSSDLNKDPKLSILMHSYYALPSYLKKCFLHFSTFPEDFIFPLHVIARFWVAEEFVEEKDGMSLDEVAEGYLNELVQRSIIMVMENQICLYRYKIHDTFKMIVRDVYTNQRFATVVDEEHQNASDCRRLFIQTDVDGFPSNVDLPKLSSLYFFNKNMVMGRFSFRKFKLLKVLSFRNVRISNIPEEIFDLFNLRYLDFRNSGVEVDVFPKRFERLQNLRYLNLANSNIMNLPPNLIKMQKLCHLFLGKHYINQGFRADINIWQMRELQSLSLVEASEKLVRQLGQLGQLRNLGITNVKQSHENSLGNSLKRLKHIRILEMHIEDGDVIDLELLYVPSSNLQWLRLLGGLKSIPHGSRPSTA